MSNLKASYRALCNTEPSIPLFSRSWWLDATAGKDNWDVVLIQENGSVVASLPYVVQHRFGLTLLVHPPFTQTLGPWLKPTDLKHAKQLSREKELMDALIAGLPRFDHYSQRWHYSRMNWLPFYWAGFEQTTRYTYVIDDLSDLDAVFAGFSAGKRKDIKKAEKTVTVRFDVSAEEFYRNHKMTLTQEDASISYSFELFKRMYDSGYEQESACTIGAYDQQGNLHAALFIVWDQLSAYNLISTIDHRYRNSGSASFLVREAIRHVADKTKRFDFEGSMIEPVEFSFRQFNTVQMPYFAVSKTPSRLLATARLIQRSFRQKKR